MITRPKASVMLPVVAWMVCSAAGMSSTVLAGTEPLVDSAPPPARIENVPYRDGYVWALGHWKWNGHSWSWVDGSYVVEQRHAHWIPDGWEPNGTQWRYVPGHWER
jgi:hypothetical protein